MNFVIRASKARSNSSDEIPIATRSHPIRRPTVRDFTILVAVGFSIITTVFLVINRSTALGPLSVDPPLKGYKVLPSIDGRLLGHFPYPEALKEDLIEVYPGLELEKNTYKSYNLMKEAAMADGIDLILLSGYRSHSLQEEIFFDIKSDRNQTAIERARVSAPPGYSEHSTGFAIDIGDKTRRETDFEVSFESTRAFRWLIKHAAKYHFTLSFPKDNSQGVSYEPWHWRFEGTANALRQFEDARRFLLND